MERLYQRNSGGVEHHWNVATSVGAPGIGLGAIPLKSLVSQHGERAKGKGG